MKFNLYQYKKEIPEGICVFVGNESSYSKFLNDEKQIKYLKIYLQ